MNKNPWKRLLHRLKDSLFHTINSIVETIKGSVHIPEVAIGPIVSSLITASATLILGLFTLSNLFSEQFLYRPLQLQESTARLDLMSEQYQQTVLNDYLQQTTQLLLTEKDFSTHQSPLIFRATTQATLAELNPQRKRYVILFLLDNQLIPASYPVVSVPLFADSNLSGADLHHLNLSHVNFARANLNQSNFEQTTLKKANFREASLKKVSFKTADLRGANFQNAQLNESVFTSACYDHETQFPTNFDPVKAGLKEVLNPFTLCLPQLEKAS